MAYAKVDLAFVLLHSLVWAVLNTDRWKTGFGHAVTSILPCGNRKHSFTLIKITYLSFKRNC